MKVSISFRKADESDICFLLALRKRTMDNYLREAGIGTSEDYHLARIREHFEDSHIIIFEEQIIGLIKLGVLKDSVHIRQLQILPEFQGRGIGGKVVELTKRKAKQLSLPVTLNVLLKNPAKSLYLRHGFKVIGQNELEYQLRFVESPNSK